MMLAGEIQMDKEREEAKEWLRKQMDEELRHKYMQKLGIKRKMFSFLSP